MMRTVLRLWWSAFLFVLGGAVLSFALESVLACTPAERADIATAAAKAGPCLEACAPLIIEEVIASSDDAGAASIVAFALPPPPRGRRVHMHRRCTAWAPVVTDAGADADAGEAGP